MITNEKIKEAVEYCASAHHKVTVRDIAYAVLCTQFEDSLVAYKAIFGQDYDYNQEYHSTYDNTAAMQFLKTYVEVSLLNQKKANNNDDISFEENKAYMLKLKKDTEDAMSNGEIDKKDGLKILTDISTKLNDRFKVNQEEHSQLVVVQTKYNSICSRCGTELYIPTKEDLMKKYNLVENKKE
jgi:hypothetical protein